MDDYEKVLLALEGTDLSLGAVREHLDEVVTNTTDRDLQVYTWPVLAILQSRTVQPIKDRPARLPLGNDPYKSLVEYCRKRRA